MTAGGMMEAEARAATDAEARAWLAPLIDGMTVPGRGRGNEFARVERTSGLKPGVQECIPPRSSTVIAI